MYNKKWAALSNGPCIYNPDSFDSYLMQFCISFHLNVLDRHLCVAWKSFFIKKSKKTKFQIFNLQYIEELLTDFKSRVSFGITQSWAFFWDLLALFSKNRKGCIFFLFSSFFFNHKFLLRPFCAKFKNRKKRISISRKFFVFFFWKNIKTSWLSSILQGIHVSETKKFF